MPSGCITDADCSIGQACNAGVCIALTNGTAAVTKPAAAAVVGGGQLAVQGTAGAPGTGPTKVVFRIEQGGIAKSSTTVTTGSSGTYSGVLTLSGKGLVTGPGTVFAATYWTINGIDKSVDSAAVAVTVDEDPPSITNAATDHAFYSSTAVTPAPNAQVSVQIQDIGAAGVDKTTARLVLGTHSYPAATAPATGAGAYQFSVPVGDVGIGAGNQGTAGFVVTASDKVGNAGSYDGGTIAIDNVPPTLTIVAIDSAKFYAGDAGVPISVDVVDPAGGSGLDTASVGLLPTGATATISPVAVVNNTRNFAPLGSDLQAPNQQGPIGITFVANDLVGNKGSSEGRTVNIDRKPPVIVSVVVTDNPNPNTNGYYPADGTLIPVSVAVDDGPAASGSGVKSATLSANGASAGTPSSSTSGTTTTFAFGVPSSVKTGTEGLVALSVVATDKVGNTASQIPATKLKIDDIGPTVSGVVVNGADAVVSNVTWFKQLDNAGANTLPDIDVQADIVDLGSGVDPTQLSLVLASNTNTQVDHGTPSPDGSVANRWHFHVARVNGIIPSGTEGTIAFKVMAADRLGHAQQADTTPNASTGTLGIDGKPPTVTFSISPSSYPPLNTDCDTTLPNGNTDPGMFCGHDGLHFWRRGLGTAGAETTALSYTASDNGSKVNTGSGTCAITGSKLPCTPAYDTSSASFKFKPNFSDATLASGTTTSGGGNATVTVQVMDAVGNVGSASSSSVAVSRLRWVQRLATDAVINLRGSPIVSSLPTSQIILAGASASADPIIALKPTGGILWTAGKSQGFSTVNANMAYDPTPSSDVNHPTPMLYMLGSSALYAMHVTAGGGVTAAGVDKFCSGAMSSGLGSPAIAGAGATAAALVTDTGTPKRLIAFATANLGASGGACNFVDRAQLAAPQDTATLGPPTMGSAGAVYYAYDNSSTINGDSGVATTTFSGTSFSVPVAHKLGLSPSAQSGASAISVAGALFFSDASSRVYRSYTTGFVANWTSLALSGNNSLPSTTPTVFRGLTYGVSTGTTGRLYAYKSDGAIAWSYLGGTSLGSVSPVSPGADGMLYFSDSANNEFVAIDPSTGTSTTSPNVLWRFTGPTSVALNGVGTEATIDSNGIAYFGQDSGNVYALITDVGDTTPPTGLGAEWPRTGFDNCNSSNTAFSCQ